MKIEIWSDVVCPFCYIGKRNLEAALATFRHRDEVEVVWRSFELDPTTPVGGRQPQPEMLAAKFGMSLAQAQESNAQMTQRAALAGLDFHLDDALVGNTRDAHRLLHLAAERGVQSEAKERFLRAFFTDGDPIADRDTLVRLAADAGLDADEAREVLDSDRYAEAVDADVAQARAYGATGVPFFVFDAALAVSGAQPVEVFTQALERAWAEANPLPVMGGDGGTCADGSCAI